METLKELNLREEAERKRAHKFGVARDQVAATKARLAAIEETLRTPPPDLSTLQELWRLAGSLSPRFVTGGTSLVSGGQVLSHLIMAETQSAIDRVVAERKKLEDALPGARKAAEEAEAKLRSFEEVAA